MAHLFILIEYTTFDRLYDMIEYTKFVKKTFMQHKMVG